MGPVKGRYKTVDVALAGARSETAASPRRRVGKYTLQVVLAAIAPRSDAVLEATRQIREHDRLLANGAIRFPRAPALISATLGATKANRSKVG